MFRTISVSLLAVALCALQSGCCCCRGFAGMMRPAPIVFNPPPVVFNPPPPAFNPPPPPAFNPPPIVVDPPNFDKPFRDNNPFKDKVVLPPDPPLNYVYERATGTLKLNNQVIGTGYSGKGAARNNGAMEAQKEGPPPLGEYLMSARRNDFRFGDTIGLLPMAGLNTFQRFPFETFGILPETNPPGNPPSGCFIVVPAKTFNEMKVPPLSKLRVVQ